VGCFGVKISQIKRKKNQTIISDYRVIYSISETVWWLQVQFVPPYPLCWGRLTALLSNPGTLRWEKKKRKSNE